MAISSCNCCLNLPPPNQNSSSPSLPSKANQLLPWQVIKKPKNKINDGSWSKQSCVLGMTCIMVGLEMGSLVSGQSHVAIAKAMPFPLPIESSITVVPKWSDKRMCPQWRANSLETIVPENLPRPSAHRRSEAVGSSSKNAPAVKIVVRRSAAANCFSM